MGKDNFHLAIEVVDKIQSSGFNAFIVGGAVRDFLLDHPINDIDIATSAKPEEVQAIFEKVIPVGIQHGTVMVRHRKESFEVTTFRSEEGYSDFRHPDRVEFVDSITTDLSRRDFTINAIAMSVDGHIVDPFDGQLDLEKRMIRAVGVPADRFNEDPLRILRALRFVSQLNFSIELQTERDMKKNVALIEKLSIERVTIELEKLFKGKAVKKGLATAIETNIFNYLPIFCEHEQLVDALTQIEKPIDRIADVFCYLTITFDGLISINQWVKAYRLSNRELNDALLLVKLSELFKLTGMTTWLVYQLPDSLIERFVDLIEAVHNQTLNKTEITKMKHELPIQSRKDIKFNGHDLSSLYASRKRGNWIRTYLKEIERAIINEQLINDHHHIKEWILSCHPPEKS